MTAPAYARRAQALGHRGGATAALEHYAAFYRQGLLPPECPAASHPVAPVTRTLTSESHEGTVLKFTQRVPGRTPADPPLETESVLIPMIGRRRARAYTLCVSSQVGCAMGCGFCQTAQMGLLRSLSPAEIVGQWWAARWLVNRPDPAAPIRNIVFMGMGEPTDNLDAVIAAIATLTDSRGPAIAMSRITVSTVGRPEGIERLASQVRQPGWHRLGLAISLNAPNDAIRSAIMPVNRAAPLADLRRQLLAWPFFASAHLCLEYVLIPGLNALPEHADQLAHYVLGTGPWGPDAGTPGGAGPLRGLVNVIPYNPRDHSPWPAPDEPLVDAFVQRLRAAGVYVKRRRTKGRDSMAACGQLGNPALRRTRAAHDHHVPLTLSPPSR